MPQHLHNERPRHPISALSTVATTRKLPPEPGFAPGFLQRLRQLLDQPFVHQLEFAALARHRAMNISAGIAINQGLHDLWAVFAHSYNLIQSLLWLLTFGYTA